MSGAITARATVTRSFLGMVQHSDTHSPRTVSFTVPVTAPRATAAPPHPASGGGRAVRLIVSADAEGYSALGIDAARQAQADLVHVLDRAVAATGLAGRAAAGWDGQAPIAVARLRDSAPARSRFAAAPAADFVLTVSDAFYGDVVRQLTREPLPGSFADVDVDVDVASKGYRARSWVHVPGAPGDPVG